MRIYEFFRKTKETYISCQINIDGIGNSNILIDIPFFKHMLEQFIINSSTNLNLISIGDIQIDYHHIIEDIGIILGKLLKLCVKKKNINRYSYFYIPLDETLSRVVIDICGRAYLKYDMHRSRLYLGNLDIDLFYDFFLAFTNNFNITLHIINLYGNCMHHKIETIFKAFGCCLKLSLKENYYNIKSTKGVLFD